ncbi:MAG: hypothetical protein ACTHK2_00555 [Dokdonella sp.]|uniref:hypothetical protein n=1 Tax=Dokdonella sp. TaxID=2291710 RepID=UPI003F7DF3ED
MTAAHTLFGSSGQRLTGFRVRPAHHLPATTSWIPVDATPDPSYTFAANTLKGRDLAYLRANIQHPNPQGFARPAQISSSHDSGNGTTATCASSFETSDPFWESANMSWFNPSGPDHANGCFSSGPARVVVHYPNRVNGVDNFTDPRPYISTNVGLFGSSSNGTYYELYHPTADGNYAIGMTDAYVSPGSSGGALFATPYGGTLAAARLLGIVTVQSNNGMGFATGDMTYNHASMWSDLTWAPASQISITSPAEGSSYDSQSAPNLIASAGSQTSQLQWKSDIDGALGSGGNVPIAGRLSAGMHTITASIGPASQAKIGVVSAATVLRTLHITITGAPTPTFTMTPTTVLIPATQTSGAFAYSWRATAYPSLDLQSSVNGGAWAPVPGLNIPATGSTGDHIVVGTTYRFRFFPHGDTTNVLGTLTVSGVAAPAPVFAANPVHGVTNGASCSTTITWSAPGYQAIDWCGKTNAGNWQCGTLSTPATGSTGVSVPVGTTYGYRFYPHGSQSQGGSFNLLGELTVDWATNSSPTFTANPAHVVVPAGAASGLSIITWSAAAYSQLDWCGKVDGGPWTWSGLSTPPVGKTTVSIPVGSTYGYRFYAPGNAVNCSSATKLGELTIYATH